MKVEEHYMFKEAVEGPSAVRRTLSECRSEVEEVAEALKKAEVRRGFIVGSGTSFHASLYLQYLINRYTDLHFTAVPASEFKAWKPIKGKYVVIGFSQSGESSDVIEAVREAKAAGVLTIGITNTPGSSLTRLADHSVVT
ncbi:MAG: glutamine--fructose-6-phosphate aminotransferase, partial [Thermoprotei archaeon]